MLCQSAIYCGMIMNHTINLMNEVLIHLGGNYFNVNRNRQQGTG